jgi:hypothetical protein
MKDVVILDALYPFFEYYTAKVSYKSGGAVSAKVECGCVCSMIAGDEIVDHNNAWRVDELCATHEAVVQSGSTGDKMHRVEQWK